MTERDMISLVFGALAEIRDAQRPWGEITITVEGGAIKFVNVTKVPRYMMDNGELKELPKY